MTIRRRGPLLIALLTAASPATAQDVRTPGIAGVVAPGTLVEVVRDDFPSTEGPVGMPDGSLLFTETRSDIIHRIAPDGSASVFLRNTNGANGLGYDPQGRLIAAQTGADPRPGIGIIFPAADRRVLVDSFRGEPFERPNDVVVDARGGVYFTDPAPRPPAGQPLSKPSHVFYLTPGGELRLLDAAMLRPNGIQLSPDGRTLYVLDTLGEDIIAFDVLADGGVTRRRVFGKLHGFTPDGGSGADGAAVDREGRLYATSNLGVQVFSSAGEHLGTIPTTRWAQNVAFVGPDRVDLYIVGEGAVYRVRTLTRGVETRAK